MMGAEKPDNLLRCRFEVDMINRLLTAGNTEKIKDY